MEIEAVFICAYCFQTNTILVDASGGFQQRYVEDCQVCCRPNDLRISINEELSGAEIHADAA